VISRQHSRDLDGLARARERLK